VSRSLRLRLYRRHLVWWQEPVISPRIERLKRAALGDHFCRPFVVTL
jgi:hypothetical protein